MVKWICAVLVLGSTVITAIASTEKYSVILGGEKRDIEEGYIYGNRYCQTAFLNPTLHGGAISMGDFNIMPRKDTDGNPTLDESEARLRIFFKPEVRVRSTGRRTRTVYGSGGWSLDKIAGGVRYKRTFSNPSCRLSTVMDVVFDKRKAQIICRFSLKNEGRSPVSAEVVPEITFLRTSDKPLEFMLQRFYGRYIDGKRIVLPGMEKTAMSGNLQSYWWRRIAVDEKEFSTVSYTSETIPFTHKLLPAPQFFGVVNLPGKGVLVWDMGKESQNRVSKVNISWEGINGIIAPEWETQLAPGQERVIQFRILTLRGINRFDTISDDWVFGFNAGDDLCEIHSVPLAPKDKLSIAATVENMLSRQILINQRSELAAMTPFTPGRVEWRSATTFQNYIVYPIKITLATFGGKNQLETSGNIIR